MPVITRKVLIHCFVILAGLMHVARAAPPKELNGFDLTACTIPAEDIHRGGPPRDGIPALTAPKTMAAGEASYLAPEDMVIGVEIEGRARAYPLRILLWRENVNDVVGGRPIAVTYCPLCHSATVFDRKVGGQVRDFGISGLLWNSNVLLYDRQENGKSSLWSQAAMRAVCGPAAEDELELRLLSSQLLSWKEWKNRHPDTSVLSRDTGHRRDYGRNPYEQYFSTQRLMFPVSASSENLADYPNKEQVVVVRAGDRIKGYPISEIAEAAGADGIVTDILSGVKVHLHYDPTEETVRVTPAGRVPGEKAFGVAHMFWFAWKSVYPEAPIFRAG
jgi:hypothetical protein